METKVCKDCGEEKELLLFSKCKRYSSGVSNQCKLCWNKWQKKWAANNRDKINVYQKQWRDNNKEKKSAHSKKWREKNLDYARSLGRKYWKNEKRKAQMNALQENDRKSISKSYVKKNISQNYKIPYKDIKKYPELIESWGKQIQLKRLIKQAKKHETS